MGRIPLSPIGKKVICISILCILIGVSALEMFDNSAKTKYPYKLVKVSKRTYEVSADNFSPQLWEWSYDEVGKRIFLTSRGSISVIDVHIPEEPTLIKNFDASDYVGFSFPCSTLAYHEGYLFVAHPDNYFLSTPRVIILDVRDLNDIKLAFFSTHSQLRGCLQFYFPKHAPNVLITAGNFYMSFWDMTNKSDLKLLWTKPLWDFKPLPHVERPYTMDFLFHPDYPLLLVYVANLEYMAQYIVNIYLLDYSNYSSVQQVNYSVSPGYGFYTTDIYKFELIDNGYFPVIRWSKGITIANWTDPYSIDIAKMINNTVYNQKWSQKIVLHKQADSIILYEDLTTIISFSDKTNNNFLSEPMQKPDGMISRRRPITDRINGKDYIFCLSLKAIVYEPTVEPITTWQIVSSDSSGSLTTEQTAAIIATTGGIILTTGIVGGISLYKKRKSKS